MAEALVIKGLEVSLISRPSQVMETLMRIWGTGIPGAAGYRRYPLSEEELTEFRTKAGKVTGVVTDKRTLLPIS